MTAERIVFIHLPHEVEAVPAGRLTMIEEGGKVLASRFAYGRRYLARSNAVSIDPISLPLATSRNDEEHVPVNGLTLFGALRDATPDAWGRRVIENRLRAPPNSLQESTYLDHAGPYRAGALDIRETPTSTASNATALPSILDLEHLVEAAAKIEEGEPVPDHLEAFFAGGPSVGGARPKAVVRADGGEWIAKFPARNDLFDVPTIERATLELARDAGIEVPRIRLQTLAGGHSVMLIERFDREASDERVTRRHMVSALTMLGLHEQDSPDSSYAAISNALSEYGVRGHIAADRSELFARMVFNILVSNDDDHLRNHAFLYDASGKGWRLSPLYDVVPKPQISQDRALHLAVGPDGRAARLDNALEGAGLFGLSQANAAQMIDRVVRAVRPWRLRFDELGVPKRESEKIATAFRRAADIGMDTVDRHL